MASCCDAGTDESLLVDGGGVMLHAASSVLIKLKVELQSAKILWFLLPPCGCAVVVIDTRK
jgi:hypothetical protein